MISIGQYVKYAIDAFQRGEFLLALQQASIAIDITAKNYFSDNVSKASRFKELLLRYSWLIELMSFPGINLEESKFGNVAFQDGNSKSHHNPSFNDLMYYIVRCCLIHGDRPSVILRFHHNDSIFLSDNVLILPIKVLWGLLGIVVFCSANKNETTTDGYYLSIFQDQYFINTSWGIEDMIRIKYINHINQIPRVILNIPNNTLKNLDVPQGTKNEATEPQKVVEEGIK